jgi:hypothetical protein
MSRNHADRAKFREWLLKLLKQGRWPAMAGESDQAHARRLGVTLEILEQATRERNEELKQQGKPSRKLGSRTRCNDDYAILEVTMPDQVYEHWRAFCKRFRVTRSTVLRSLIHHFLITKIRPRTTGTTWLHRGQYHGIKPKGRRHAKTRVTLAAQIALDHIADLLNVTATGIIRGLIADTLERGALPNGCVLVSCSALWRDPAEYLQGKNRG